jgi:hypothetical protein
MKDGATKAFIQGYNAEDCDTQIIVAADVVQAANDKEQLVPQAMAQHVWGRQENCARLGLKPGELGLIREELTRNHDVGRLWYSLDNNRGT